MKKMATENIIPERDTKLLSLSDYGAYRQLLIEDTGVYKNLLVPFIKSLFSRRKLEARYRELSQNE
ncbi:MAG: hypothetical protein V3T17_16310 [Pseudomonadales bacterium]